MILHVEIGILSIFAISYNSKNFQTQSQEFYSPEVQYCTAKSSKWKGKFGIW